MFQLFSLTTAMTGSVHERTELISRGRLFSFLGIALVTLATVPATGALSAMTGSPHLAWLIVAAIISVSAFFLMLPISKAVQERKIDQSAPPITLRAIFSMLASNKCLLAFYGAITVFGLTNTASVLLLYFARVNMGNENLFPLIAVISIVGSPLVSAFLPRLTKRFDQFQAFMAGLALTAAASAAMFFAGCAGSIILFLAWSFI
jgi:Na+/melibiose symporter-like transporter